MQVPPQSQLVFPQPDMFVGFVFGGVLCVVLVLVLLVACWEEMEGQTRGLFIYANVTKPGMHLAKER